MLGPELVTHEVYRPKKSFKQKNNEYMYMNKDA